MRDKTPAAMARELAAPFGVRIEADEEGQPRTVARLRPGETPHAFIERMARVAGVSLTDTPEGNLKLAGRQNSAMPAQLPMAMAGP